MDEPKTISSVTAPTNPHRGQVWQNISGATIFGIPDGDRAAWNGTTWVLI